MANEAPRLVLLWEAGSLFSRILAFASWAECEKSKKEAWLLRQLYTCRAQLRMCRTKRNVRKGLCAIRCQTRFCHLSPFPSQDYRMPSRCIVISWRCNKCEEHSKTLTTNACTEPRFLLFSICFIIFSEKKPYVSNLLGLGPRSRVWHVALHFQDHFLTSWLLPQFPPQAKIRAAKVAGDMELGHERHSSWKFYLSKSLGGTLFLRTTKYFNI